MNEQRYFGKLYLHKPPVNLKCAQLHRNHIRPNIVSVYNFNYHPAAVGNEWETIQFDWIFFLNFQISVSALLFTVILQLESNTTIHLFLKTFRLYIFVVPLRPIGR